MKPWSLNFGDQKSEKPVQHIHVTWTPWTNAQCDIVVRQIVKGMRECLKMEISRIAAKGTSA